jgi:copper homeostasis protein
MNSKLKTQDSKLLEVCSGSITSAITAQEAGAQRIELCDNLNEGGTTPSAGTIMLAKQKLTIPVFVLIRPRTGDFLYSELEFEVMKQDILFCKGLGAEGVVLGVLKADGSVDIERTGELVELARPMQVTFHRAFDMTADPFQALEDIISLGIERILTSGQASGAMAGAELIEQLNNRANNRIIIMPGGGITEQNVAELINKTGVKEVHASLRSKVKSRMIYRNEDASMGKPEQDEYAWMETDAERVWRFCEA